MAKRKAGGLGVQGWVRLRATGHDLAEGSERLHEFFGRPGVDFFWREGDGQKVSGRKGPG